VDRVTVQELKYLRAMAEVPDEAKRSGDVAAILGRSSPSLAPTRARLVQKGLLYTAGHGFSAFTVPQFGEFLRRSY
jgi:Mn-dependent DtxR family transcriptional regulator